MSESFIAQGYEDVKAWVKHIDERATAFVHEGMDQLMGAVGALFGMAGKMGGNMVAKMDNFADRASGAVTQNISHVKAAMVPEQYKAITHDVVQLAHVAMGISNKFHHIDMASNDHSAPLAVPANYYGHSHGGLSV